MRGVLLAAMLCATASAQVCGDNDLFGGYGFQLSGTTTISGTVKPTAAIGRLDFQSGGDIAGTSSVNFNGLFLGNPVSGTYIFKPDCSVIFGLQDDSGAWQHFQGKVDPGGERADFYQTDPNTGVHGVMMKLAGGCGQELLRGSYAVSIGSQKTVTMADGKGVLSWKSGDETNTGTYKVDDDCFVELNFGIRLRGIVVNGGRTVLAVQTDPGKVATATFTAL